ncbi:MAG TPA: response regulator transcription factor [Chthonomonadaceae bacterium]|nr:response regulator transcription factor [Chthonomonadaceae bacterium]
MIRVLIADDHGIVRSGIRTLLEQMEGLEVVAEAADGQEALRLAKSHQPDIAIMDIGMPGLNGVEAAARMAKQLRSLRVIILSMHTSEEHVCQALRAGAAGYVVKDATTDELETAVRTVARGERYLSPTLSEHGIAIYLERMQDASSAATLLTSRQREILQLVAEGYSTREISQRLHLSHKTVEAHRAQIMQRLDMRDVAGLVRYAIRAGITTPD